MNLEEIKMVLEISKLIKNENKNLQGEDCRPYVIDASGVPQAIDNGNQANDDSHYEIGKPYMIQTVTAFYKGILEKITSTEFILIDCSWVADTGRFSEFVQDDEDDKVKEEEPFNADTKVIISRSAMICAYRRNKIIRKLK